MAVLTSKARKSLKSSVFGLPKSRKYPMPDRSHAINAKARATQQLDKGNLSASQKAVIDAKANKLLKGESKMKDGKSTKDYESHYKDRKGGGSTKDYKSSYKDRDDHKDHYKDMKDLHKRVGKIEKHLGVKADGKKSTKDYTSHFKDEKYKNKRSSKTYKSHYKDDNVMDYLKSK